MSALCTVADVVEQMPETAAVSAARDALLTKLINVRSSRIEDYCGARFTATTGTITFDSGAQCNRIELPAGRGVRTVTNLYTASSDQPESGAGTGYTEITTGIYLWPPASVRRTGEPATVIELGDTAPTLVYVNIRHGIKLTGALDWADVPDVVRQVCIRGVIRAYLARGSGSPGETIVGGGEFGPIRILRQFSPEDEADLEPFRTYTGVG